MGFTQPLVALGLPFISVLLAGIGGYKFLNLIVPKSDNPVKFDRFEAGNIPTGEGRLWYPLQYYGYLLVYTSIEPILTILFLASPLYFSIDTFTITEKFYVIIGAMIAVLYPTLSYVIKQVNDISQWEFRRETNV